MIWLCFILEMEQIMHQFILSPKLVSENIKWNLNHKCKKIFSLLINTRNANCFTGKQGYKSLEKIADLISIKLTEKQKRDEDIPQKIRSKEIMFGCTGTIGEIFPEEKILSKISELVEKIKYTQNKYIWMKAALGIMTTDTQPKMAMEECYIGNSLIKIFGIAKGSGNDTAKYGNNIRLYIYRCRYS